ncbi:unnamed protein product, partial [marine sediment metagenome]
VELVLTEGKKREIKRMFRDRYGYSLLLTDYCLLFLSSPLTIQIGVISFP